MNKKNTILIKILAAIISIVACSAIGILSYYLALAIIVYCGIEMFVTMLVCFLTLVLSAVVFAFLSRRMTNCQLFDMKDFSIDDELFSNHELID